MWQLELNALLRQHPELEEDLRTLVAQTQNALPAPQQTWVQTSITDQAMTKSFQSFPHSDGTTVQLRFGEREFAVLDVSLEVSTVNWTVGVPPGLFVSAIDRISDLAETDPVILQMSLEPGVHETTVSELRRLVRDEEFDLNCKFVRIDLSPTRSAAWHTLPSNGDSFVVTGIGEETAKITVGDSRKLIKELLTATATSKVDSQQVINSLTDLTRSITRSPGNQIAS
jgi:hypothetical protein